MPTLCSQPSTIHTVCGTKKQTSMTHFGTKTLFLKEIYHPGDGFFSSQDLGSMCAVKKASNAHIQCNVGEVTAKTNTHAEAKYRIG